MSADAAKRPNYIAEYLVAAGYLLFFCLAFSLCSTFYYLTYLQPQQTLLINTFATALPPTTPTPHILPTDQQNASQIFKDDFSDDSHGWAGTEDTSIQQVTLGKLLFKSRKEDTYAFTGCAYCPSLDTPFYLQADFSTGAVTDRGFGIYFNFDQDNNGSFFLFRINPEARKYYFYHGSNDGWSMRAAGGSSQIKSFPAINTLGIYANQDTVEFYVNGEIVDSYIESGYSFHKGGFGFYVDGSNFQLVIDNLVINKAGNE
ncbi:MAG TPA: hypothetical protein VK206_18310 [Anaerolineales bacterium]|nr:hypothetical protein [Anaerolineales bacterium]